MITSFGSQTLQCMALQHAALTTVRHKSATYFTR